MLINHILRGSVHIVELRCKRSSDVSNGPTFLCITALMVDYIDTYRLSRMFTNSSIVLYQYLHSWLRHQDINCLVEELHVSQNIPPNFLREIKAMEILDVI